MKPKLPACNWFAYQLRKKTRIGVRVPVYRFGTYIDVRLPDRLAYEARSRTHVPCNDVSLSVIFKQKAGKCLRTGS